MLRRENEKDSRSENTVLASAAVCYAVFAHLLVVFIDKVEFFKLYALRTFVNGIQSFLKRCFFTREDDSDYFFQIDSGQYKG